MIETVFTFNPVRSDFIQKALDTLYKYTDMTNNRVVVVDQTEDGLKLSKEQVHLILKPHRNLGFSKAHNEAIIHGIRWGATYVVCCNDDVEWINNRWWDGVLETFATDSKILAVNPECPRVPMWGYGRPHGEYTEYLMYKPEFTEADYDYLLAGDFAEVKERYTDLPASFPLHKVGLCDAIAMWMPVFKTECFEKIGLFDEKFYPGGGEDYDFDARIYREYYRAVSSTRSWVWHHWGQSKDETEAAKNKGAVVDPKLTWMNTDSLWPPERNLSWNGTAMVPTKFDPWGKVTLPDGTKQPMYRIPEIHIVDI
jgi:GT2 family glycosyltransferase